MRTLVAGNLPEVGNDMPVKFHTDDLLWEPPARYQTGLVDEKNRGAFGSVPDPNGVSKRSHQLRFPRASRGRRWWASPNLATPLKVTAAFLEPSRSQSSVRAESSRSASHFSGKLSVDAPLRPAVAQVSCGRDFEDLTGTSTQVEAVSFQPDQWAGVNALTSLPWVRTTLSSFAARITCFSRTRTPQNVPLACPPCQMTEVGGGPSHDFGVRPPRQHRQHRRSEAVGTAEFSEGVDA